MTRGREESGVPGRLVAARAGVVVIFVVNGATFASMVPRYPWIIERLHASTADWGLVLGLCPIGGIALGWAAAGLMAWLGSRTTAAVFQIVSTGALLLLAGAPSLPWAAVAMLVMGAFDALTDTAMNYHALVLQREYGRSILNSFHGWWSIGAVAGGLVGSAMAQLRVPLMAQGVGTLVVCAALSVLAAGALSACGKGSGGGKRLRLGFLPSWSDGLSMTHLIKTQLEKAGYQIKLMDLSEAGPLYAGLSQGAVDLFPSAWPDVTQKSYMDKYRTYIEDLGTYYDSAQLCWSVPDYSSMQSIEDIKPHASQIGNKIIGIEPGAGLTKVSQEDVIPAYGLGDMKFLTSSTTGMLAELKKAVDAKQEIVVTLWHPFWANTTYGMRDLKDPKGALGKGEGLHFLGREGFAQDYPEIAKWLGSIKMDEATYGSLEDLVVNTYGEGREDEAAIAWSKKHPQYDFKKS